MSQPLKALDELSLAAYLKSLIPGLDDPKPAEHAKPLLFNLAVDPSEAHEISADHPDVVARLTAAVEKHRATVTPVRSQLIDVVAK